MIHPKTTLSKLTVTTPDGDTITVDAFFVGNLAIVGVLDDTWSVLHVPTQRSVGNGFPDGDSALKYARYLVMNYGSRFVQITKPDDSLAVFDADDLRRIKLCRALLGGK